MSKKHKTEQMKEIRNEIVNLKKSPLYPYRTENKYFPVIGEGDHDADIVFIGEAPGKNEAETGRPFCGRSGQILDELLESIGLPRSEVYVTNIVKDRPQENRDPTPEEIELYSPFLDRQIEIIQPKVIATLGRFSMDYIMQKYGLTPETISKGHGKVHEIQAGFGTLSLVPLYHPAAAIYTRSLLETLQKDFKTLKKFI